MRGHLNERWKREQQGAIRALNGPDSMDDYAVEVAPLAGNVVGFAPSETLWHGHVPFMGERLVVRATFLIQRTGAGTQEAVRKVAWTGRAGLSEGCLADRAPLAAAVKEVTPLA